MHQNVIVDSLNSTLNAFYHTEVSIYYREYYCKYIDTLVINLIDSYNQQTMRLLLDAEQFCIYCTKSQDMLNKIDYDMKLDSEGIVHFSGDIELLILKHKFTNIHLNYKISKKITLFCDVTKFFELVIENEYNWKLFSPNIVKLLHLTIVYPATTVSCERNFRLSNLIKSDIRSTMSYERLNYLYI